MSKKLVRHPTWNKRNLFAVIAFDRSERLSRKFRWTDNDLRVDLNYYSGL